MMHQSPRAKGTKDPYDIPVGLCNAASTESFAPHHSPLVPALHGLEREREGEGERGREGERELRIRLLRRQQLLIRLLGRRQDVIVLDLLYAAAAYETVFARGRG